MYEWNGARFATHADALAARALDLLTGSQASLSREVLDEDVTSQVGRVGVGLLCGGICTVAAATQAVRAARGEILAGLLATALDVPGGDVTELEVVPMDDARVGVRLGREPVRVVDLRAAAARVARLAPGAGRAAVDRALEGVDGWWARFVAWLAAWRARWLGA